MSAAREWLRRRHGDRFEHMGMPEPLSGGLKGRDPYEADYVVPPPWHTWGEQQYLVVGPVTGSEASSTPAATTMILYVKVKMPTTWHLRTVFTFTDFPAGIISGTNPITVQYTYTHGVGMASVTVVRTFTVTPDPTSGTFDQIVDDQVFPADAINLSASVEAYTPGFGGTFTGHIQVTAMAAPHVV